MSDALINGVAGAGGGIIARLITYPLQTMLTLVNKRIGVTTRELEVRIVAGRETSEDSGAAIAFVLEGNKPQLH
ncbi:hypothetical protein Syun_025314 [Stephania yunnanensis]|uniref:Uncharacterized protein n=1 Tax=Stephania yunnanensis TaxID=152371 RepID=A0AAP0ERY7_9MAGN